MTITCPRCKKDYDRVLGHFCPSPSRVAAEKDDAGE